jgi:hypothetical protein
MQTKWWIVRGNPADRDARADLPALFRECRREKAHGWLDGFAEALLGEAGEAILYRQVQRVHLTVEWVATFPSSESFPSSCGSLRNQEPDLEFRPE